MNPEENLLRVPCWGCKATGVILTAFPPRGSAYPVAIPCARCKGTKTCPEIMRDWEKLGAELKDQRLKNRQTLHSWAKHLGIHPVTLSEAERGIIDPKKLPINRASENL